MLCISSVSRIFLAFVLVALASQLIPSAQLSSMALAEGNSNDDTRARMAEVYRSYSDLQTFIGSREQFVSEINKKQIADLLVVMRDNFHKAEGLASGKFAREGLSPTLQSVQRSLEDISLRFSEGKKDYALWKLRSLSNYCVTCHTRFAVANDFGSSQAESLKKLNSYQRADYFFATRQFTKAAALYREVIADEQFIFERFDALRRLLVIETRVYPDPSQALSSLREIQQETKFSPYEQEEIQDWISSLTRWQKEKPLLNASDETIMSEAQRLLRIAHHGSDSVDGQVSFIELLRASALLHGVFDRLQASSYHAKVLYLLGSIYSDMPQIFQSELPEMFLEECIRKFPGTDEAKKAFRIYQDKVQREYTGSAGTNLPAEEKLKVQELKDLAFGSMIPDRS